MKKRLSKFALAAGIALALAFTVSCSSDDDGGGGGKGNDISKYRTVLIGTQRWMAENLNYAADGSKCYDDSEANCNKYGRLYDWTTAKTVCPSGWHLPSKAEWDALKAYIERANSCIYCDAEHLKAKSGWNDGANGQDTHGFSALPGGGYGYTDGDFDDAGRLVLSGGHFYDVGDCGYWWSASEYSGYDNSAAYNLFMDYDAGGTYWNENDKPWLFSVRCVQD